MSPDKHRMREPRDPREPWGLTPAYTAIAFAALALGGALLTAYIFRVR